MSQMVLGIFHTRSSAEDAISRLEDQGYNPRDISIIMKDQGEVEPESDSEGSQVLGGAISGAATGGMLGALAGLLIASGIVPGLGVLLIGGPLAATLGLTGMAATTASGAATGALAGGVVGGLTGLGLSDDDAKYYEQGVLDGGILIAVPSATSDSDFIAQTMSDFGGEQIKTVNLADHDMPQITSRAYSTQIRDSRPAYFSEINRESKKKQK